MVLPPVLPAWNFFLIAKLFTMIKTICIALLMVIATSVLSQPTPSVQTDYLQKSKNQKSAAFSLLGGGSALITNSNSTKNFYLKKSKTQKIIAWILLGTGTGIAAYSLITINNYTDTDVGGFSLNITGALIAIGGAVVGASSIPFFISSARNKRKAATLTFGAKKNLLLQENTFAYKIQPAITLKIGL